MLHRPIEVTGGKRTLDQAERQLSPIPDVQDAQIVRNRTSANGQEQSFRLLTLSIGRFEYSDDQLPVAETEKKEADETSERKQ